MYYFESVSYQSLCKYIYICNFIVRKCVWDMFGDMYIYVMYKILGDIFSVFLANNNNFKQDHACICYDWLSGVWTIYREGL